MEGAGRELIPAVREMRLLTSTFMYRVVTFAFPQSAIRVARYVLGWRVKSCDLFYPWVQDQTGLEIGGPSGVFRDTGILPLYRRVGRLDNCVYSPKTLWKWQESDRLSYSYHPRKPHGRRFILEATDLRGIPDGAYDFVLSSHSLEHTANPLKALKEWMRVIKPTGAIVVVLPHYRFTFDHRRAPTSVEHMLEDYVQGTDETDMSHLQEVLELHDLAHQDETMTPEELRARCSKNEEHRWMHHHVFDERNSRALLETAGLSVQVVEFVRPHHLVLLGCREPSSCP